MKSITTLFFTFFLLTSLFSQAPCGGNQPAGNSCSQATPICDLDGYCGNTSSSYTVNSWSKSCGFLGLSDCGLTGEFCGSIENNSFIKFTASASTVTLSVWVGNCSTGQGIQIMVFSSANLCGGKVTNYYCNGQFSPSPNNQSITINGLTAGNTYYLMIDGFAGDVCDYTFTANSGVSLPVNVTPSTTTLCLGESVVLTASGGNGTYTWDSSPDLSATSGATVTVTPPTSVGTYTYTANSATNNTNCNTTTAIATVEVQACGCPIATDNNGPLCLGDLIDLEATIASGVLTNPSWSGPNGFTSTSITPTGINPPTTAGSYDYVFTCEVDGVACSSTTTVVISDCPTGCNMNTIRTAFTNAGCIELQSCIDDCSIYFLNPQSMTGSQAQTFAEGLGANLVSIQSQAENDCILSSLTAMNETGKIWIGLNDELVEGTFVWYDQSPVTYTNWAPGEPNNSGGNEDCVQIYPTGSYPGSWNDLPCSVGNTKSIIEVNLCPVVSSGPDITICDGETAVVQSSPTILGSQPYTYSWSNGPTVYPNSVSPSTTTEYILTSEDRYGCIGKDTMEVFVTPLPVAQAGNDVTICIGESVTLNGTGGAGTWDNGVTNGVSFYPITSGKYKYTVNSNGCISVDSLMITVKPTPNKGIYPDRVTGCSPLKVNFTNLFIEPGVVYTWDFGDGTSFDALGDTTHTFVGGGCYDVQITANLNGCIQDSIYENLICIDDNPVASFTAQPAVISIIDPVTVFTNNSTNASSYIWNFGDNSGVSNAFSSTHTYPDGDGGSYVVTLIAISDLGCRDTASSIVEVLDELIYYVPNAFTPDEDEFNPTFKPIFTAGYDPTDYHLYIFNRWGELIFESRNIDFGWDGTYSGSEKRVMEGIYTWRIEFKTKRSDARKIIMGNVTLIK